MSKKITRHTSENKQDFLQKLMADLMNIKSGTAAASTANIEILSMVVNEAIEGIDIVKRYPDFYQSILKSAVLRETFLEALQLAEKDKSEKLVPLAQPTVPNLGFLKTVPAPPIIEFTDRFLQINWQQTTKQLQAIFSSPLNRAYRSSPDLFEGPWFTLLDTEIEAGGTLYRVLLECAPSEVSDDSFSIVMAIELESENIIEKPDFPALEARLQWGQTYDEHISIIEQGRLRFRDIPRTDIYDTEKEEIKAELNLTLKSNS